MSVTTGLGWPDLQLLAGGGSGLGWPSPVSRETARVESRGRANVEIHEMAVVGDDGTDVTDINAAGEVPEAEAGSDDGPADGLGSGVPDAEPAGVEAVGAELADSELVSAEVSGAELREATEGVCSSGPGNEGADPAAGTDADAGPDAVGDGDGVDDGLERDDTAEGALVEPSLVPAGSDRSTDAGEALGAMEATEDARARGVECSGAGVDAVDPGAQRAQASAPVAASPTSVAGEGVGEGVGDGLGSVAQSWSQDLPGKDYQPEQRLRASRARGAEAAANADVQSRFLGAAPHDDRKSRLASAWEEPANRQVADAALFGNTAEAARDELAEVAAAVTSDDPVSRGTGNESGDVDVVETFRQQEDKDQDAMTDLQTTPTTAAAAAPAPVTTPPTAYPETTSARASAPAAATTPAGRAQTEGEALPAPRRTRVMTVANQKGGVGKTTTTVNVAAALAKAGLRVLVLDLDPQGNASTALGIPHHAEVPSVYDVLVDGAPMRDVVQSCPDVPNLLCAPATIDLAGAEIELVSLVAREMRLGRALSAYLRDQEDRDERIDYVLIDCPPSLGLLTINAFVAAEEVFIPIQCEYYALEGLSQLLKNIELIKAHLNPSLHVSTILLTMYDGRTRLSAQVADEVRRHFGQQVIRSTVPRSVRISEAPSHGQTVMTYDPTSSGALSYAAAAVEIARQGAGEGGIR